MDKIALHLSLEEINSVLKVLGDLPTHTGAWNLLLNIKTQAEAAIAANQPQAAPQD